MIDFANDPRGVQLHLLLERAKYERFVSAETAALIEREMQRVVDRILSPSFRQLTQFQQQRALELFRELDRQIHAGYVDVNKFLEREMSQYALVEGQIAREHVVATLTDASTATVAAIRSGFGAFLPRTSLQAIAALPIQGLRLGEWFDGQANTMSRETRRIIQQGIVEGKGMAEISRRIVADQRTQGPVLSRRAVSEARAITRTTVTAVHNHAAMASYESLSSDVTDSYRYVAVLDARTSTICRALDGNVYRYSDPKRRVPPQHVNCRSTTVPLLKGGDATLADQRDRPLSLRSYADWLTAQTPAVQNDILGPTRAQWFRDRKLSLADAIDQDNRVLTLAQLRTRLGLTDAPTAPALAGAF